MGEPPVVIYQSKKIPASPNKKEREPEGSLQNNPAWVIAV
jgi:hypothetical protein